MLTLRHTSGANAVVAMEVEYGGGEAYRVLVVYPFGYALGTSPFKVSEKYRDELNSLLAHGKSNHLVVEENEDCHYVNLLDHEEWEVVEVE